MVDGVVRVGTSCRREEKRRDDVETPSVVSSWSNGETHLTSKRDRDVWHTPPPEKVPFERFEPATSLRLG